MAAVCYVTIPRDINRHARFFHVAPPGLRVGEIVQPGHWGRETLAFAARGRRGIQHDSDAINLIWEAALEAARLVGR